MGAAEEDNANKTIMALHNTPYNKNWAIQNIYR